MKVYLCYEHFDDGQAYESAQWTHLAKIVDSEEKAKQWAFESVTEKCRSWIDALESLRKGFVSVDEDGPYVEPYSDEVWKEFSYDDELSFYDVQFDVFEPNQKSYTLRDFNGYEFYNYYFDTREVE